MAGLLLLLTYLSGVMATDNTPDPFLIGTFPNNFIWATATAAYQIEGAVHEGGKGENIWDRFCHTPGHIYKNENADVADDSYHHVADDVQLLKNLGVSHYRFSLSWSRIIPDPRTGHVNPTGVAYYTGLLLSLRSANIEPLVTLYHWDLPQVLQDMGGWQNESMIGYFEHFAQTAFHSFGHVVKYWITFNEPWVVSILGYGNGEMAPGLKQIADAPYKVAHTILKAHAEAWHYYHDHLQATQGGKVGITLNSDYVAPKDVNSASDREAADRSLQFALGWFAHPIFIGDYPAVMKQYIGRKSSLAGLTKSRLPAFTTAEIARIKGTHDFFGLNHYTTRLATYQDQGISQPGYWTDSDVSTSQDPSWPGSGSSWLKVVPWGFRRILNWVKVEYYNPPLLVTENGVSDNTGTLDDTTRISYYNSYINEMLKAVTLDHCNVIGYTAWSLMDNFEWARGYSEKFGLHYVDFNDPKRPRKEKKSVAVFRNIIKNNGFIKAA